MKTREKKKKGMYMHTSSPETGCKSTLKEVGWKNDAGCYGGQLLWAGMTAMDLLGSSRCL